MNKKYIYTILFLFVTVLGFSQKKEESILEIPKGWTYEKIEFPLDFAKNISYEGFEELRFSPEMFKTEKEKYFTYIFSLVLKNTSKFEEKELTDFLLKYYRGLSKAVADGSGKKIDVNEIEVHFMKKKDNRYFYEVEFLDTFTDGRKITLQMEFDVFEKDSDIIVLALVSPNKGKKVWNELDSYREILIENIKK
ncbi:hypothetical protein [Aureivirga sp. CE67]|uniref:hypothetical protein n=1 Tax=Aureivirga sp. CE67 TaxID=1788983 RepID=UPI0018CA472C|nr:hypothetical protein [Aureivirga sp. CE67]